jgi:3-mercaptopyruvate sulfurtransferase SseA
LSPGQGYEKVSRPTQGGLYCNSGHLNSSTWFVMSELLGNKDARLFDGSMHEWTKDPARPASRKWENLIG